MAPSAHASKDRNIEELVRLLFRDRMFAVKLVNGDGGASQWRSDRVRKYFNKADEGGR